MEKVSWNMGRGLSFSESSTRNTEDMEFWKSVLADSQLRSRVIRDLEVQSISSRSPEDLVQRYRGEEMLTRGASRLI